MVDHKSFSHPSQNSPKADLMLSNSVVHLLQQLAEAEKRDEKNGENFTIAQPDLLFYKTYESVRNTVEYAEEHLLLRGAIMRYLRRSFYENKPAELTKSLLTELIRSGYVKNGSISLQKVEVLTQVVGQYQHLHPAFKQQNVKYDNELFLGIISSHLQDVLVENDKILLIISYIYDHYAKKFGVGDDMDKGLSLYSALERTLFKSDNATIRSRLFRSFFGDKLTHDSASLARDYPEFIDRVRRAEKNKRYKEYSFRIRKESAELLNLISIFSHSKNPLLLKDPGQLKSAVYANAEKLYSIASTHLRRGIIRSVIFLVITKALVGVAVEVPYDLVVHGEILLLPLIINLIFPPLYLLMTSATIARPTLRNTHLMYENIMTIVKGQPSDDVSLRSEKRNMGDSILLNAIFFGLSFATIYGVILLLIMLEFNIVSIGVFLVYFSTVSFFSYRITYIIKELKVYRLRNRGVINAIFSILTTPFIKIGQWFSARYQGLNLFVFIFDFFLELPFKSLLIFFRRLRLFIQEKQDKAL